MKNKKLELVLVFLLLLGFSFYNFLNSCQLFSHLSFDNQIIITWQFTALSGFLPYKEVYFPYGILFYGKATNGIFSSLYILMMPALFLGIFVAFYSLWKKRLFAYIFFIAFFLFILLYTNTVVFSRYGIIVCFSLLVAYFFFKRVYISLFQTVVLGALAGCIFSLVNDQGIYASIIFIVFLLINPIIRGSLRELQNKSYYLRILRGIVLFSLSFFIGFLPFGIYLFSNNMLAQFISSISNISDFSLYAKTPFIPYSMTKDNIFVYIPLLISIFLLTHRFSIAKKNITIGSYFALALILVIVLLEQKSIIRSISTQITFVAFLLIIILLHEVDEFITKKKINIQKRIALYLSFIIVVFIIALQSNTSYQSTFTLPLDFNVNKALHKAQTQCLNDNIALVNKSEFKEVEHIIRKDSNNPKIFNYLSDPIYYVLFQQLPPYYFTIYEATPLYAQKENIKYIEKQKVTHVIYNLRMKSISDGVPDYVRGTLLFHYILDNFVVQDKVGEFVIFKKKTQNDFFQTDTLKIVPEFKEHLLTVHLGAIPKSEGIYKSHVLREGISGTIDDINRILKNKNIVSSDKLLVLKPEGYSNEQKEMKISIRTANKLRTEVAFHRCDIGKVCIINISNLPLFYKERQITNIEVDKSFKGNIMLLNNQYKNILW